MFNVFSLTFVNFPGQYQIQWLFKSRVKFNDFSSCVWTLIIYTSASKVTSRKRNIRGAFFCELSPRAVWGVAAQCMIISIYIGLRHKKWLSRPAEAGREIQVKYSYTYIVYIRHIGWCRLLLRIRSDFPALMRQGIRYKSTIHTHIECIYAILADVYCFFA